MSENGKYDRSKFVAKPMFRSARETGCYVLGYFAFAGIMTLPGILGLWSLRVALIWMLCVALLGVGLWELWRRWGRKRFPLPPDKQPPGPESPFWRG